MGFLSAIFGGGDDDEPVATALAEPEDQRSDIDPNMDEQFAQARRARQSILSRRGRSDLVTGRSSGVSIVGDGGGEIG